MATRLFALIIGIDRYQSGDIWDLNACVDDAKQLKRFLTDNLKVPKHHIHLLLNHEATKRGIEDSFMTHLVNNDAINPGDAIVVYFAGHGSVMSAPEGWFEGLGTVPDSVQVLCPYDHEKKFAGGRIAGISDRSMHALFRELAQAKGDNITFIVDSCFSPTKPRTNNLDRSITRWTCTTKAKPDDLYRCLWPGARGQPHTLGLGFYTASPHSHTLLAACSPGEKATEVKGRGKFTHSLLDAAAELSLHRTSYLSLFDHILRRMTSGDQKPVCLGKHLSRIVFDAVPFAQDSRYIPAGIDNNEQLRIEAGTIQGIVEGSEFSIHLHNYRVSRNPIIATAIASKVYATWCVGKVKTSTQFLPASCWAHIVRWNNHHPFSIHLKTSFTSLSRIWKLRRTIPTQLSRSKISGILNVTRVRLPERADLSMTVKRRELIVEIQHDAIAAGIRRIVKITEREPLDVIHDAARFFLHLHRTNPRTSLGGLVNVELFRLAADSWTKTGDNLIQDGIATVDSREGDVFTVILRNSSNIDLWPYLFYMDPDSFKITKLYGPRLSSNVAPLPHHSHLEVGSGRPESQAISFSVDGRDKAYRGFLKLFLVPAPVTLDMIEQGHDLCGSRTLEHAASITGTYDHMWDIISIPVRVL